MKILRNIRRAIGGSAGSHTDEKKDVESLVFSKISTERALGHAIRRGVTIETVIDVGASNGSWSAVAMRHLPQATYLLIEAQQIHKSSLDSFCASHPRTSYFMTAAGDRDGHCYFDDRSPFGGLAAHEIGNGCVTPLPMSKVDTIVESVKASGPYLLKLDTHGFELPILEGAGNVLQNTALAVIEAYPFRLQPTAPMFHELCGVMYDRGFQCVDFSEPMWRAKDMALWQLDLFFQRRDSGLLHDSKYD